MPQPKGFEPFMFVWVMQVAFTDKVPFSTTTYTYNKLFISTTEQGWLDYKAVVTAQGTTFSGSRFARIVKDYGKQKWYNDKVWMQAQMNDSFLYGNFQEALLP